MPAFYNEFDPFAAEWLKRLVANEHIAPGDVDARSIKEVEAADLDHYTQAHFFAGIGVWSHALRLAGWPDSEPVWTGSCPCQPFSQAGRQRGFKDERHLWPEWFRLIRKHRPWAIFGEQVGGPAGLKWLDAVCADLEGCGYAVGACDLPAAGVGAPHIRQRLYFVALRVADASDQRREGLDTLLQQWQSRQDRFEAARRGAARVVAHTDGQRDAHVGSGEVGEASAGVQRADGERERLRVDARERGDDVRGGVADSTEPGRLARRGLGEACDGGDPTREQLGRLRDAGDGLGDTASTRRRNGRGSDSRAEGARDGLDDASLVGDADDAGPQGRSERRDGADQRTSGTTGVAGVPATRGFWANAEWIHCRDDKWRAIEPGSFPLAHGAPARVGRLRAYGNALCAPLAAEFIKAVMEILGVEPIYNDKVIDYAFREEPKSGRYACYCATCCEIRKSGEAPRERARDAWKDWDEAEIAREIAPWPNPTTGGVPPMPPFR